MLDSFLSSLEHSAIAVAMRESLYLFPAVETLHILAFSILIGSIIAFDLRLLGAVPSLSVVAVGRLLRPLGITGFLVALPTGAMLLSTEATSIGNSTVFQFKMLLVVCAGLNLAVFQRGPWRQVARWERYTPPKSARTSALLSIVFWVGVLVCGRLIAYL